MAEPADRRSLGLHAALEWIEDLFLRIDKTVDASIAATLKEVIGSQFEASKLGFIPEVWTQKVSAFMLPLLEEAYDTGAISASIQLPQAKAAYETAVPDPVPEVLNPLQSERMATYTNRLNGIGDHIWQQAREGLVAGMEGGESIDDLAMRVSRTAEVSVPRATTIARTEIISAANAGSMDQARIFQPYAPVRKEWLATEDGRTRITHRVADAQEVELEKPFTVGGHSLDFPGDPGGPPGEVINCRCTVLFNDAPMSEVLPLKEPTVVPAVPAANASIEAAGLTELKAFTARENKMIERYWSDPESGSNYINPKLREGSQVGIQKDVELLDSAVNKHKTNGKVSVYRGVSGDLTHGLKVGDRIRDQAFLSTTTDRSVADRFAQALTPDEVGGKVMRLDLPKGFSVLPIESGLSEYMLPRNIAYRVKAVTDREVVLGL